MTSFSSTSSASDPKVPSSPSARKDQPNQTSLPPHTDRRAQTRKQQTRKQQTEHPPADGQLNGQPSDQQTDHPNDQPTLQAGNQSADSKDNTHRHHSARQSGLSHSHADNSSDAHRHSPHQHSEASTKQIIHRLSRLEGHIRGIKTMVQDQRNCPDVLIQVAAVRGGLDRVARLILDEHLSDCITRAAAEGNIQTEIDALKSALDRFIG